MPNRPLSEPEHILAQWMLENGLPEGRGFLSQLTNAEVTDWQCPCGCASINFQIKGQPEPPPGVHVLGDYLFGDSDTLSGIFIFESAGVLSGIEIYGLATEAPKALPKLQDLRPVDSSQSTPPDIGHA
jgi:hypothetical protein